MKYNGSIAKHNASYYAYNLAEAYGSPFTFKQIAKQSEQYSGTSWHYKYLGKVTGSISITIFRLSAKGTDGVMKPRNCLSLSILFSF